MKSSLFALIPMVLVSALSLAATPKPAIEMDTYYYSDASFTDEVGWRHVSCNGAIYQQGYSTPYFYSIGGDSCTMQQPMPNIPYEVGCYMPTGVCPAEFDSCIHCNTKP